MAKKSSRVTAPVHPIPEKARQFFSEDEWWAIKEGVLEESKFCHLLRRSLVTQEEAHELAIRRLAVEDLLNGRYTDRDEAFVLQLFNVWNDRIGDHLFGF